MVEGVGLLQLLKLFFLNSAWKMHERASELIAKLNALMKDGCISDRPQFSKLLEDLNGINYGSTPFEVPFLTVGLYSFKIISEKLLLC